MGEANLHDFLRHRPVYTVDLIGEPGLSAGNLSLDTIITENHRCSQEVRAFFKSVISSKFHFSTFIQTYFKNNVGKTYRDVVDVWYEEEERKRDPLYMKSIAPQFEYNQFIRDFFLDSANKGETREKAIEAWNEIKKLAGSNQKNKSLSTFYY
ncbi:DUF6434 domain-containing protein [Cytobacillus purgationiresistens]|uniref:DUF6434 domain-containing protein n=1 Tax=Cytobacillus purgationiresistens TaxID=863449 RepID=A0ABU0AH38_9BACI|nr:DUF6434 domain-containing protein [Cytobacillus purgationiresistens]MDQ0270360.1 hypothetical protein [Cytobacillus purgationiresistens]